MKTITEELAETLRAFDQLITDRERFLGGLSEEMAAVARQAREVLAKYEADMARPRHTCGATQHMRADGTPGTRVDYYASFEIAERVAQRCKALKTANLRPFRMIEE